MQFCKNCGLLLPQGATVCPQCGAACPAEAPAAARPQQAATPVYEPPAPTAQEETELSLGGFVGSLLLFEVPLVGLIFQLVWACGGTKNATRKKLSTAMLIRSVVNTMLMLVVTVLFALFAFTVMKSYNVTPPVYYTW